MGRRRRRGWPGVLEVLAGARRVLILAHDYPDPDALAAAHALRTACERRLGVECAVAFGGHVGRAENRAMVRELALAHLAAETLDFGAWERIVLVDTQPGGGNNRLPAERAADVVVDHHPKGERWRRPRLAIVRPGYGASSTIAYELLARAGLEPDRRLATALFYGIQTDTQDLGRDASRADMRAAVRLYPRIDHGALGTIRHPRLSAEEMRVISRALSDAKRQGPAAIANLGEMPMREATAEMADLLVRLEGVDWALAYGRFEDAVAFSLRAAAPGGDAAALAVQIARPDGSAGGHDRAGGGFVPAGESGRKRADALVRALLRGVGAEGESAHKLLARSGEPSGPPGGEGPPGDAEETE